MDVPPPVLLGMGEGARRADEGILNSTPAHPISAP